MEITIKNDVIRIVSANFSLEAPLACVNLALGAGGRMEAKEPTTLPVPVEKPIAIKRRLPASTTRVNADGSRYTGAHRQYTTQRGLDRRNRIRELLKSGISQQAAARKLGISYALVQRVASGEYDNDATLPVYKGHSDYLRATG